LNLGEDEMTKNFITGGTVSVEDCVKHSGYPDPQYAPTRKIRVELIFNADDGADGQDRLDVVAAVANTKVAELLGKPVAIKVGAGATSAEVTTLTPPPAARAPRKAATKPAETVDSVAAEAKAGKLEEKASTPSASAEATATQSPPGREYSDRELKAAMSAKHQETQDAVSIRNLVKSFRPADWTQEFTTDDIAQNRRQEFLKGLEALKKS
jgi:hypothetical protein